MVDRRDMLKSAGIAGMLIGPSALSGYPSRASAVSDKRSEQSKHQSRPGGDWPVSTDSSAHLKVINEFFDSGATIVNIHSGQADQERVIDSTAARCCRS